MLILHSKLRKGKLSSAICNMNQKYSFTFMTTTNICRKATRESSAVINMLFLQDKSKHVWPLHRECHRLL